MENKLKYYRFMKDGMTQQDLANLADVTRQTIVYIEKGKFNPSVKLALKLALILNCSVEELFILGDQDCIELGEKK